MQGHPGNFYIQHCCPFGAVGSESNSGQVRPQLFSSTSNPHRYPDIPMHSPDLVVHGHPEREEME